MYGQSCCVLRALVIVLGVLLPYASSMSQRSDDNPLDAVVDQLSSELLALKSRVEAQENEITSLKAAQTPTVAFSAYISNEPRVHASKGSTIPFRGVITNTGGGYNPSSSTFTAPVSGQYYFLVHADCSGDMRSINLALNGRIVVEADNDHGDGHVTGSGVLHLNKGDVVTTTFYSDGGYVDAGIESTFSGFLVK